MQSKLDTLVTDIYAVLDKLNDGEDISPILEPHVDEFLQDIKVALMHWCVPQQTKGNLRMSNIGVPNRRLWFDTTSPNESERMTPNTHLKFLYGHILEQVLLLFVRAAGHHISDEQVEVEVDGIKGHMDAVIDGEVVDIKTASPFAFQKFQNGTLADNDPFGYLAQLAGYEQSQGTGQGGFLVINKVDGQICLFRPDDLDKPNVKNRIAEVKDVLALDTPPEMCYNPEPEGKAGNMVINKNCSFCPHKFECHKDANDGQGLIGYRYHNGVKYFTHVEKEPRVERIS